MRRLIAAQFNPFIPKDCRECEAKAAAGQWKRDETCRPQCFWRQFDEWEHRLLGLWSLVQAGETYLAEDKSKRIRFWVDPDLFRECREGGHPAFRSPFVEPWEVLAACREIAATLNEDYAAQQQMLSRRR